MMTAQCLWCGKPADYFCTQCSAPVCEIAHDDDGVLVCIHCDATQHPQRGDSWQRHELRDQTWLNIGTNGGATIKQIQDGDQVVIYLSAVQVMKLVHALSQNRHGVVG